MSFLILYIFASFFITPRTSLNLPELKSNTKTNPIKLTTQERKAAALAKAKFERTISMSSSMTENEKSMENYIRDVSMTSSMKMVRPVLENIIQEVPKVIQKQQQQQQEPSPKITRMPVQSLPEPNSLNLPDLTDFTVSSTSTNKSPRILPGFETPTEFIKNHVK